MNAENFHEYLKNPSLLYQANYQELKSLVVQYPYSSNLRLLLLLKSLIDNHKDFDRNLVLASLYSIDRTKLFEQVNKYEHALPGLENVVIAEDYLELKDLSTIEDVPEKTTSKVGPTQAQALDIEETLSVDEPTVHKPVLEDFEDDADFLEDITKVNITAKAESRATPPLMSLEELMADEDFELDDDEDTLEEEEEPEESAIDEPEEMVSLFKLEEGQDDSIDEIDRIVEEAIQNATVQLVEKRNILRTIDDGAALMSILDSLKVEDQMPYSSESPSDELPTPMPEGVQNSKVEKPIQESRVEPSEESELQTASPGAQNSNLEVSSFERLEPTPSINFSSWLQQLRPPQVGNRPPTIASSNDAASSKHDEVSEDKGEKLKANEAKKLADQSVAENLDIASETLAALLEAQGHYEKAIAMYKRLMMKYPEKSAFFAAKIEQLKSK